MQGKREVLSPSFVDRFAVLSFQELPPEELQAVLASKLQRHQNPAQSARRGSSVAEIARSLVDFHVEFQKLLEAPHFNECTPYAVVSIRELLKVRLYSNTVAHHQAHNPRTHTLRVYQCVVGV